MEREVKSTIHHQFLIPDLANDVKPEGRVTNNAIESK